MKDTIKFLIIIFTAFPLVAEAQMFSVDERSRTTDPFAPYLRAGIKAVDMTFTGNLSTPPFSNDGAFEFSGLVTTMMFESAGFTLKASLGNDFSGLEDHNYFDLGISFLNPFYIIRNRNFLLGIPIRLSSNLITIRNEDLDLSDEFSQTNLSAGAGAITQFHFPEVLGATLQLIPNYGFSSSSGGFIGGGVFSVAGKARINFYNLLFGKNISFGYDYNFATYDIDGEQYDYDFTGHTLTLGISL